jgi:tetratricopeptide (TPR) repeat protein
LDGLPLAIELAAARIKLYTPHALLERLNHRLSVLTSGARDLPSRQQTLRGAIEWSYHLLSDDEQRVFARLGVFVGGWRLDALEPVCGADLTGDVYDLLESLISKSLVRQTDGTDGEPRFHMLETIREYALERFEASGEAEAIRRAHAEHFVESLERLEPELHRANQAALRRRLDDERGNLETALEWLFEHDIERAARLATSLQYYWWVRGWLRLREYWYQQLAERRAKLSIRMRASVLKEVGAAMRDLMDFGAAHRYFDESLELYHTLEDGREIGYVLRDIVWLLCEEGRVAEALPISEEVVNVLREWGNKNDLATALNERVNVLTSDGQIDRALVICEQALTLRIEHGNLRGIASSYNNLGHLLLDKGDLEQAEVMYHKAFSLARNVGMKQYLSIGLRSLANVAGEKGDWNKADALAQEDLALAYSIGINVGIIDALAFRGVTQAHLGEFQTAHRLLIEAMHMLKELPQARSVWDEVCEYLMEISVQESKWERAVVMLGALRAHRERTQEKPENFPPYWLDRRKRMIEQVREQLGAEKYAELWERGRGLSLEQVLADYLREYNA